MRESDDFDKLTEEIDIQQKRCAELYDEWQAACFRLRRTEEARRKLFLARAESVILKGKP
jgi:hypothetical protein